jgi:hypothetical protein
MGAIHSSETAVIWGILHLIMTVRVLLFTPMSVSNVEFNFSYL